MNKAFEDILERLETADSVKVFGSLNSGNRLIPVQDAKQIVQEVAEEYKKETYFNLDNVTLHKCTKCGGNAQHRVNQRGSWACGCFECGLFKSDYDHQKAIQEWEDYCKEYNNGWIPCSERLPEYAEILVNCTIKRLSDGHVWVENLIYNRIDDKWKWTDYPDDRYVDMDSFDILAWQPLPEPYKEA